MTKTLLAVLFVATIALATGCGSTDRREERGTGSMTEYDAALTAKQALDDESLDPESPASKQTLLVGKAVRDKVDGTWWWRVQLVSIDRKPTGSCMWVQLVTSPVGQSSYSYYLDDCAPQTKS